MTHDERICPIIHVSLFNVHGKLEDTPLIPCLREKCMAWEDEETLCNIVYVKGYCKLIQRGQP